MFLLRGPEKWALFAVTLLAILLAWVHHFNFLTNFFLNYFPAYNKFRTVSMILVVAELTMPLIGFLGLKEIYEGKIAKPDFLRAFKWATGITAGICLFFLIFGRGIFNFSGVLISSFWPRTY